MVLIARGDELERLEDFRGQIAINFPKAEIVTTSEAVSDEVKNKPEQLIQMFPVKPLGGESDHYCRHFEHRRSYGSKEKTGLENRWVERRIFIATGASPGISTTAKVINVKTAQLKPVSPKLDFTVFFLILLLFSKN